MSEFMIGYLLPHQEQFYRTYLSGASYGEEEHAMHRIARYLISHKRERVTLRDLKRATHLGDQEIHRTMYADHGAEGLAAYNWVGAPQSPKRGSTEWSVNPAIYVRFASRVAEATEKLAQAKQRMREAGLRV